MRKAGRMQVITPASVVSHWKQEARVWAPDVDVSVTSYDRGRRGDLLPPAETDVLVLDEFHYLKTHDSKRTVAVLKHAAKCLVVRCASATPVPNGSAAELYPILRALFPEVLQALGVRRWDDYVQRFCYRAPKKFGQKPRVYGTKNAEVLRPLLGPHFYRRRVADVYHDLPPLRLDVVTMDLAATTIEDAEYSFVTLPDFDPDTANPGEQAKARRALGIAKVLPVANIIRDELERGEYDKIVVFAHHLDVIETLRSWLAPFGVCGFTGEASQRERQKQIDAFNGDPALRVFVGQQGAAGTGINLHAAREVVLVEPSWTPGENSQAIRRVYRPAAGVKDSVRARIFAVARAVDERLMRSLARKTRDMESLGIKEVS